MTKRVQIIGHVTAAANAFVGFIRELTVDISRKELRVHDGVTPGGFPLLRRDLDNIDGTFGIGVGGTGATTAAAALANLFSGVKGSDITSADPLVIPTNGDFFNVTGNTNFSSITVANKRHFTLQFAGTPTITVGSGIVLNNDSSNYSVSAEDTIVFQSTAADTVTGRIIKADGTAIISASDEEIQDIVGSLVATGGTKTGITVTYQDGTNDMDFVVVNAAALGNLSGTNTGDEPTASVTVAGISELATSAETITGTAANRVVTPAGLQAKVASTTKKGISELATDAEANTGTSTTRVITPANLDQIVTGKTGATITASDELLFADVTDGNKAKKATVQSILDLVSGLPVGVIMDYAGTSAPSDWLLCDGSAHDANADATLQPLFAVIGNTFGGSNNTNFQTPDLRGRVALGLDNLGGSSANRLTNASADSLGGSGGAEAHTLTTAEMPTHTHTYDKTTGGGSLGAGTDIGKTEASTATGGIGDGNAHANDQPWLALGKIIKK